MNYLLILFTCISGIKFDKSVLLTGFDSLSRADTIYVILCTIGTHMIYIILHNQSPMEINSHHMEYLGA